MAVPFALTNATLVNGDSDSAARVSTTVIVDATGLIEEVAPSAEIRVPDGYRQIDVATKFVTPGLINAHAHLFSDGKPLPALLTKDSCEGPVSGLLHSRIGSAILARRTKANLRTQLRSGVTTIRSLGDVAYEVVRAREAITAGKYVGPRVLASGPLLAVTGGHGTPTIALVSDSPWEARKNVRINLRHRVDVIKVAATGGVTDARVVGEAGRPQMTEEEMAAICAEAHQAGVQVAAHAESLAGVKAALRAGVDTIEHGSEMDTEVIDLFGDNPRSLHGHSALIPTFMAALPLAKLDASITRVTPVVQANAIIVLDRIIAATQAALANGITIGMGTDSSLTYVTHYNTWREMDYAVRYGGLSPTQALRAATTHNAAILGLTEVTGSIEPGKEADLVVLDRNPVDGFRAFAAPHMVIARGAIIERPKVTRFPDIDDALDSL